MSSVLSRIRHGTASNAPLRSELPWWEALPENFASTDEPFALQGGDKLRVASTAVIDVGIRTAAASAVAGLALPLGYHPRELRRALDDVGFYLPMAESGDPTKFFRAPPSSVRVRNSPADWYPRFDPDDGTCETIRFDSPFMPVNPRLHARYLKHTGNRIAHARYWFHGDEPRPTIIAVHGFSADLYLVNEWFFAIPWFYRMGCDVVLFTLPFHGERQPAYSPFSGHGYFAGGPSHINEAVAQSVMDLRILIDWLMNVRGVPKIGVTGVSLGGYTSSVLAVVEPRLSFAIPNVPVVTFPDLVLEWEPIGVTVRTMLRLVGRRLVDARRLLAVSNPLTYAPVVPKEGRMIVGGVGDRLAPPKHSLLLWEHWDRCALHWFPGSHLLHLDRGVYLEEIAKFLHRLQFLPPQR